MSTKTFTDFISIYLYHRCLETVSRIMEVPGQILWKSMTPVLLRVGQKDEIIKEERI